MLPSNFSQMYILVHIPVMIFFSLNNSSITVIFPPSTENPLPDFVIKAMLFLFIFIKYVSYSPSLDMLLFNFSHGPHVHRLPDKVLGIILAPHQPTTIFT